MGTNFQKFGLSAFLSQFLKDQLSYLSGRCGGLLRIQKQEPRAPRQDVFHRKGIFIPKRKADHGFGQARANPMRCARQGLHERLLRAIRMQSGRQAE